MEFCRKVQNSLSIQVLHSPILALLHGCVVTVSKFLQMVGFDRFSEKNAIFGSVSVLMINML